MKTKTIFILEGYLITSFAIAVHLHGFGDVTGSFRLLFLFIDENWILFACIGVIGCVIGVSGIGLSDGHGNYDWNDVDYEPQAEENLSSQITSALESTDIEAETAKQDTVVAMKCPVCSAPLRFGDEEVVKCDYCKSEVRRN